MLEILDAIHEFLSRLGYPVYPEDSVPSDAVFPYLTWTPAQLDWRSSGVMPVRIWDRAFSITRIAGISDALAAQIGDGQSLPTPSGYIYLAKGDPFAQQQPLQNSEVKALYINLNIHTLIQ